MERNPSEEVKIDRFLLEEESETHASKYEYWSGQYVEAVSVRDMYKRQLERLRSNLSLEARKNPNETLGKGIKVTESAISDYVTTEEKYIELEEQYFKAKKMATRLNGILEAFTQRRDNLKDLVKLWIKNYYYSDVSISNEARETIDEKTIDRHRKQLKKTLKKRGGK